MAAPCDLRFDCGRICLDLVATTGGAPAERLTGPEQLTAWLVGSGLVPRSAPLDGVDGRWVARFRALRELLRRVVHDELRGRAADADLALLNSTAAGGQPPAPCVVRTADDTLARALPGPPDCAGLLAAVARDAIGLLTDTVARGQLRQCAGESCQLVYLDTSRGRRRRWCSSEVCGNRERVARHRRRTMVRRANGATGATTGIEGGDGGDGGGGDEGPEGAAGAAGAAGADKVTTTSAAPAAKNMPADH